jgi:hypothetical protein
MNKALKIKVITPTGVYDMGARARNLEAVRLLKAGARQLYRLSIIGKGDKVTISRE